MSDTLRWSTSGRGDSGGGACDEAAACSQAVHGRDSGTPDGGSSAVTPATRAAFPVGATAP
ncbi:MULTISPECIES: DUF397 domain-containing protein [unclassified Streptomyces]|uniref:DUF397 domain-containing protein n=1 Tax=unclassified Streptomyces TaxID=2593676 RepID=UPI0033ECC5DE